MAIYLSLGKYKYKTLLFPNPWADIITAIIAESAHIEVTVVGDNGQLSPITGNSMGMGDIFSTAVKSYQ